MTKTKKISYFLKIALFIGVGLIYFFGLFTTAHAYDLCSPFFQGFFCGTGTDECSYKGKTRCYDSTHKQTCGDYDSDSCLEWSSPRLCSGNTSCGYGKCDDDERPSWYCSGGKCLYRCAYRSSCKSSCECSEGPCCDGCYYKSSVKSCDFEIQTQYGCPWGSACGADVGKRTKTKLRYCSGSSAKCTGKWGGWLSWTKWRVADGCSANEVCRVGNSQCQYSSSCVSYVPEPVYPCPEYDDSNDLMISLLGKKEDTSTEWKKEIEAGPGKEIDFLLIVTNSSQEDFDDLIVRVEMPQEIIYKGDLRIGEEASKEDITEGLNISFLPSGAMETIIFKGEVSSEIDLGERDVIGKANVEDLFALDSIKVVFEKTQKQTAAVGLTLKSLFKKWYIWFLLIFVIVILYYFVKGLFTWSKK